MSQHTRPIRQLALASLVLAVAATACTPRDDDAVDTTAMRDTVAAAPATAAPAAGAPSDAQIAHIAVTANSLDSASGAMAKDKATNADVKGFAQTMITDHGSVNQQAVALATKLNVTPEDNDVSRGLKASADSASSAMRSLSGAAFDSAYIAHEVAYHQTVLDALDRTLIPSAQNAELKALLEKVRPAIAAHLERAKSIQAKL